MNIIKPFLSRLAIFFSLLASPISAHAAGGFDISNIFLTLVMDFSGLWISIAILVIVVAGFTLIVSEDEGAVDKAKKTIIAVLMGGIITTIILAIGPDTLVSWVFIVPGTVFDPTGTGATGLGLEAVGVGDWLTSMAAMLGIVIVIIGVVRAATSFGGDEAAYTNVRNVLLQVIIGLIIIGAARIFRDVFFVNHEPSALIALVSAKISIVFGFILLIAVAILVYAGFRMVISFGNEEDYSAAKSLAIRVVIGIAVILVSYSLVVIVANIL